MTHRKVKYWVIPPQADAEFAAGMEDVLDTYEKPYNSAVPVLCMDEQPVQLVKETRTPIEATLQHGKRVDYEYERAGTANLFMFSEPLAGWREVAVRERKTKIDWAIEMARLLEVRYAGCEKVIVVCDHLNTHTRGAFYEAFEPERARRLARQRGSIEFCGNCMKDGASSQVVLRKRLTQGGARWLLQRDDAAASSGKNWMRREKPARSCGTSWRSWPAWERARCSWRL